MLWKFVVAVASLITGPHLSSHDDHLSSQELTPYPVITDHGPQTVQEHEQAFRALYSRNDMKFSQSFKLSAGIKDTKYRWPGYPGSGKVPYIIDSSLSSQKALIERAMEQYNKLTCIKFTPRKSETDYIKLVLGNGCNSYVGKQGKEQIVNLGQGCHYIGTIVHELGHAIGLFHEHQRSDRHTYLWVYEKNVTAGQEHNFKKTPPSQEIIETTFNHNSIMIYGNYAFSKQPGVLMTMQAKNGKPLYEPYTKPGLDGIDIDEVKKLYKCK